MHILNGTAGVQLTYCTNIHAGESWAEMQANLDECLPLVRDAVCPDQPFGVGLRLSARAASELAGAGALECLRDRLARLRAYVFTVNAFPFGSFHGTRVKEQVYEPDWRHEERRSFTVEAARILAGLLPEGGYGSISTVPGAFGAAASEPHAVAAVADGLLRTAAALVALFRETGRTIVLALEPEPCCLIETAAEARTFFETRLLSTDALKSFAGLVRTTPADAERLLRRHVGICYDVCHGAVVFEDPVAALASLEAAGISVPKVQLSTALRVAELDDASAARLQLLDTGTYLHQVAVRRIGVTRFLDLPEALAAYASGAARGEWRIHCHVPIHRADFGPLVSTQAELLKVLDAARSRQIAPHLEVETYTWDVLPREMRHASKVQEVIRELRFVLDRLAS